MIPEIRELAFKAEAKSSLNIFKDEKCFLLRFKYQDITNRRPEGSLDNIELITKEKTLADLKPSESIFL
jgi:hypothetical protein